MSEYKESNIIKMNSLNINSFNFPPKQEVDDLINSGLNDNKIKTLEKLFYKNFNTGKLDNENAFKSYRHQSRLIYGNNSFNQIKKPHSFLFLLKDNFKDPILLTLAGLAILSSFVCLIKEIVNRGSVSRYDFIDSIVILIGIILLGFYGSWSDYKFSREDIKIKIKEFEYPLLINNNIKTSLSSDLVVGDIIILNSGDEIPADCLILPYLEQNTKVEIDESIITGETDGIEKGIYDILLAGTYCLNGLAKCLIINVGMNTKKGKIMLKLNENENISKNLLQVKASILLQRIIKYTCLISVFLLVGNISFNIKNIKKNGFVIIVNFIMEVISFAALAIPEGLPFCLTLVTSSSRSMLFNGDISVRVKSKKALDSLISLKVLCFDKTGTLTHNILKLININLKLNKNSSINLNEKLFNEEFKNLSKNIPILRQEIFKNISSEFMKNEISNKLEYLKHLYTLRINLIINNQAIPSLNESFIGNKLDIAILKNFNYNEIHLIRDNFKKIRIIPLCSKKKCMITIVKIPEEDNKIFSNFKYMILLKGAPELIVNKEDINKISSENICIRKIFCAWIPIINIKTIINLSDEEILQYISNSIKMNISFLSFEDPLRSDAKESINLIKNSGIQCIIVTGDSTESAVFCAKKIGLLINPLEVLLYKRSDRIRLLEIDDIILESFIFNSLTTPEIKIILPKLRIISRCTPEDKERLIKILQECNKEYSIGICGDGINDAMAMKQANISFSFSNCTSQIPKNAASIILEKSFLKGIVKSIQISRSSLRNIRGFLQFQITIATSIVLVTISSIFLTFKKPENKKNYVDDYMPEFMTSIEILWLNFFIDALACFFFGKILPDTSLLNRMPEIRNYKLILFRMKRFIKFNAAYNFSTFLFLHILGFDRIVCLLNFLNNILIISIFSHKIYSKDNILKNFLNNWLSIFSVIFYFSIQLLLTLFCTKYFGYKLTLFDIIILIGMLIFTIFIKIFYLIFTNKKDKKKIIINY